jgi:DNA-binding NtrC family response regulator
MGAFSLCLRGVTVEPRKTVLIVETEATLTDKIEPWLRKQGYYAFSVDQVETIIPLLDSKDRIYAIVLVDDPPSKDSLSENLKILKQLAPEVPIIIVTPLNDAEKERKTREAGIFYYHCESAGMDELKTAVSCAVEYAVEKELFMPFTREIKT